MAETLLADLDSDTLARLYALQAELSRQPGLLARLAAEEDPLHAEQHTVEAELRESVAAARAAQEELAEAEQKSKEAELLLLGRLETHARLVELRNEEQGLVAERNMERKLCAQLWRRLVETRRKDHSLDRLRREAAKATEDCALLQTRLDQLEREGGELVACFGTATADASAARESLLVSRLQEAAAELQLSNKTLPRTRQSVLRLLGTEGERTAPPRYEERGSEAETLELEIAELEGLLRRKAAEEEELQAQLEAPTAPADREVSSDIVQSLKAANARLQGQIAQEQDALDRLGGARAADDEELADFRDLLSNL